MKQLKQDLEKKHVAKKPETWWNHIIAQHKYVKFSSTIGSASISARSATMGSPLPISATTPVPPAPRIGREAFCRMFLPQPDRHSCLVNGNSLDVFVNVSESWDIYYIYTHIKTTGCFRWHGFFKLMKETLAWKLRYIKKKLEVYHNMGKNVPFWMIVWSNDSKATLTKTVQELGPKR